MSQYQRMVSYLYEYKQGVKGVNVGFVRIEQRGKGCRISLQMRRRNLGQLSNVAVFRQRHDGIRYYTIGTLAERNGDYHCRIEAESENLMGSGIALSDVDGIVLYQDDAYYVATTWKNQAVYLGESRIWDPTELEDPEELEAGELEDPTEPEMAESESMTVEPVDSAETPEDGRMPLEQSDMPLFLDRNDAENHGQRVLGERDTENHGQLVLEKGDTENHGQQILHEDSIEALGQPVLKGNDTLEENEKQEDISSCGESGKAERKASSGQNGIPAMRPLFPIWTGMPLFRRRPMGNGNIAIPQMAEWSNGSRHMAESGAKNPDENIEKEEEMTGEEASVRGAYYGNKEQMEEQTICKNCPFKRKDIDYGKRILMTFPVMRPFPGDQQTACVRIEPQDLGCLPMQMWTLANNHFLLQGYYCYRHLIFMETGEQKYALGVPGIYDRRSSRQAEQFGFVQFRAICGGRQCDGAFGYWIMPLSC